MYMMHVYMYHAFSALFVCGCSTANVHVHVHCTLYVQYMMCVHHNSHYQIKGVRNFRAE